MSTLEQAAQAMDDLLSVTKDMKNGTVPDPMLAAGLQAELVYLRWKVGEEFAQRFNAKERSILSRKTGFANSFLDYRKQKITIKESEMAAIERVRDKYEAEIQDETTFIRYRTLLDSMDNAIAHAHAVMKLSKA